MESLRLGNVISVSEDGEVAWIGADTVVVQLGDVLDRGDTEIGESLAFELPESKLQPQPHNPLQRLLPPHRNPEPLAVPRYRGAQARRRCVHA